MESQHLINTLFALVMALLGWLGRELWSTVKDIKRSLSEVQRELPEKYVQKEDLKDALGEMRNLLHRIWDRLDSKVDKP